MKWLDPSRLGGLYALLMIATVGYALARLTWHLAGYSGLSAATAAGTSGPGMDAAPPDLAPIAHRALFGRLDAASAPPTRLPLQLRGAVMATPAQASSAWIAQNGAAVRRFGIGDTVAAGATLRSVGIDHVLLDVDGKVERLAFPRNQPKPGPQPAVAGAGDGTTEQDRD